VLFAVCSSSVPRGHSHVKQRCRCRDKPVFPSCSLWQISQSFLLIPPPCAPVRRGPRLGASPTGKRDGSFPRLTLRKISARLWPHGRMRTPISSAAYTQRPRHCFAVSWLPGSLDSSPSARGRRHHSGLLLTEVAIDRVRGSPLNAAFDLSSRTRHRELETQGEARHATEAS